MKSFSDPIRHIARPLPDGYLPSFGPGWFAPSVLIGGAFFLFAGAGQLRTDEPLGVIAIVAVPIIGIAAAVLVAWSRRDRGRLAGAWAVSSLVVIAGIILIGAADAGEGGGVSPVLLTSGLVIAFVSLAFGAAFVVLLTVVAATGVFAAVGAADLAGEAVNYELAAVFAMLLLAMGLIFATRTRAESRRSIWPARGSRPSDGRMSSTSLEQAAQASSAALALFDAHGHVTYANPGIERLLGAPVVWPPMPAGDGPLVSSPAAALFDAVAGNPTRLDFTVSGPGGVDRVIDGVFFPVDNGAGLMAIDVTDVRALVGGVSEAQRMETVGVIASGLAHDFNNLLSVVLGNLHVMRSAVAQPGEAEHVLDETVRACDQAAELIKRLMDYAKPAGDVCDVLVESLVTDATILVKGLLPPSVELVVQPESRGMMVCVNASALQQVLVNLVLNARDALLEAGRIELTVEAKPVQTGSVLTHHGLEPGDYAVIAVADTGAGMDSSTLARVFEPFFTTKEAGSGLGLAAAQGLVRSYGGVIDAESVLGEGATFRVYLPAGVGDPSQGQVIPQQLD
ncbi:MAG TPA: ATP-binding protein [Dehalococcoidia bacterium]|nr:ATP-binding protein [Dehalococcoidia bacterium]